MDIVAEKEFLELQNSALSLTSWLTKIKLVNFYKLLYILQT